MNKKVDILILFAFIIFAVYISLTWRLNLLPSMVLFFVLPTFYLFLRGNFNYKKVFISSLAGAFLASIIDAVGAANRAWWVPQNQLVIPWRPFGYWVIDDTIWFIFYILFVVTFYAHFLDKKTSVALSRRFYIVGFFQVIFIFVLLLILFLFKQNLHYAYLVLGSLATLPILIPLLFIRNAIPLFEKFFLAGIFFFIVNLTYEIVALKIGLWQFPGEYIGTLYLAGVAIPMEEFIFYILISAFSALAYYEIFVDDLR